MDKIAKVILVTVIATSLTVSPASALTLGGDLSETKKLEIQKKIDSIKTNSEQKIAELKAKAEKKTQEVRTKACEARKDNIATRLNNRVEAAKRHKSKFDSIKKRVDDFALEKSLKSDSSDQLNTKAIEAGEIVNEEITALENLDVSVDCTKTDDLAVKLDAFKTEVGKVRESLKNYRESIRLYSQEVKKLSEAGEAI